MWKQNRKFLKNSFEDTKSYNWNNALRIVWWNGSDKVSSLYTVTGYTKKKMKKIQSEKSPFELLFDYQPAEIAIDETYTKETIKPFKNQIDYFLAGNLKNATRNNENLLEKQLVVLDYDGINMLYTAFLATIQEKLKGLSFILYPTISNYVPGLGLRFRLVIDTDRAYTENENKRLLQNVINMIEIPCDAASQTYSQLMGLPVLNQLSTHGLITKQKGEPLKVDDYLFEPVQKRSYSIPTIMEGDLTHENAVAMVQAYVDRVGEKLLNREYYLNPYMNIKYAYEQRELELVTVEECLTILALGNDDWATNNIEHFKRDTAPVTNGTPFTQFFGWAVSNPQNDFDDFEINDSQQIMLSGNDLKFSLIKRRKDELERARVEWEMAGAKGKPPSLLSTLQCALILQEYIEFCLFDAEENTRLAMYQPKEGTWTQNETQLRRVIGWLEPKHNSQKASEVIYHIWKDAKIKPKTVSRHLVPVKNGVFNLNTKQLEPFSPQYVFTSKIATDYIENPLLPKIDGWDIEAWLKEVSCGDEQITALLWEVISDAINGNYSRKKSIWLIGSGSNGKGTYQQLLYNLIGIENIATLKINQFGERFKLALLVEKVAVIGDDVGAGIYIDDSSEFNSVVTNETVLIEIKNKMPYAVKLYVTVIQSTNEMPKIRNKTKGTYRRLLIVPFNASFEGTGDDWKIKDDYIHRPEVLQYVLHKAVNMDFEKFTVPDVSKKLLEDYKQENDPLVDFKENVFDQLGVNKIPFYIVYSCYKSFCQENNFKQLSKIKFSKQFLSLLGVSWTNKKAKYSAGDLGKVDLMNDFNSFVDYPEVGKTYQSIIRNDLKLLADVVSNEKEKLG